MNSLTNSFEFINKFIWIHQQLDLNLLSIHQNSSMNSFEFIRKFNWIYQQIQIFWNYRSFLLFGFFDEIIYELRNEFIELNLILKHFLVSQSRRLRDSRSHNVCMSVCMSQTLIRFYWMNSSVNSSMISSINQKYFQKSYNFQSCNLEDRETLKPKCVSIRSFITKDN